jgi:hypothetical protein
VALVIVLGATAGPTRATPSRLLTTEEAWDHATQRAAAALADCARLGVARGVFGDVEVRFHLPNGRWTLSASQSLGALGRRAKACVRDAIASQFAVPYDAREERDELEYTQYIGTPAILLPPAATLMPLWRQVVEGGDDATAARAELSRILPPDTALTREGCFQTTRSSIRDAEELWLAAIGSPVSGLWRDALAAETGLWVVERWDSSGAFVGWSRSGLCLVPFDAERQAALRGVFDSAGTCLVGDFEDVLLRPRVEFPSDETYVSISMSAGVQHRRVCAITTAGSVTCCGNVEPRLPPAPASITSIALGYAFACGLDGAGNAICWGDIAAPPHGRFIRLSASDAHVCGLRPGYPVGHGEIVCWGSVGGSAANVPAGRFSDVATAYSRSCAVRTDGQIACWRDGELEAAPLGRFSAVAAVLNHACGVRRDGTVGCWNFAGGSVDFPVDTPLPGQFQDIVAAHTYDFCGRRRDDTVACWQAPGPLKWRDQTQPPPTGRFRQLATDTVGICGLRDDGRIACWGERSPWRPSDAASASPNLDPLSTATAAPSVGGLVVDEYGRPIAGAEVMVRSDNRDSSALYLAATPDQISTERVITDADGRWTVPSTLRSTTGRFDVAISAPGREVVAREREWGDFARVTLRPASTLDVVPMCGFRQCAGTIKTVVAAGRWIDGTHVERLAPGSYRIRVLLYAGEHVERRGAVTLDVDYVPTHRRVGVWMSKFEVVNPAPIRPARGTRRTPL